MKRRIERLGFDEETVSRLQGAGIRSAQQLFEASILDIMVATDTSLYGAKSLLQIAASKVGVHYSTAADLMNRTYFLPSGMQALDMALGGGLHMGSITEIVGGPGIGKTQLCICCCVFSLGTKLLDCPLFPDQCLISNTLVMQRNQGQPCSVIYFDTERKFDPQRVAEIASNSFPGLFGESAAGSQEAIQSLLNSIKVYNTASHCTSIFSCLVLNTGCCLRYIALRLALSCPMRSRTCKPPSSIVNADW
jgi:hypothetical protein